MLDKTRCLCYYTIRKGKEKPKNQKGKQNADYHRHHHRGGRLHHRPVRLRRLVLLPQLKGGGTMGFIVPACVIVYAALLLWAVLSE